MFRARVLTAILLVAVIGSALFYFPPIVFQCLVMVAVVFALAEFFRLSLSRIRIYRLLALVVGVVIAAVQMWQPPMVPLDLALILGAFVLGVVFMWRSTVLEGFVERWAIAVCGVIYIGLTLPYLGRLRLLDHGAVLIVMTLAMVALSDTAAFTVGRLWGHRKLAAMASPNKTMEGFYASFLGSIVAVLLTRLLLWPELPLLPAIGLALIIGFVGPMGDLIESAIKRAAHVKDSGWILPGHGGMLDRSDAYLFTAPIVYYYVGWFF